MNPATNKIYLDIPSNQGEEEEEVMSMDGGGDQKFFLTAAAIAEQRVKKPKPINVVQRLSVQVPKNPPS